MHVTLGLRRRARWRWKEKCGAFRVTRLAWCSPRSICAPHRLSLSLSAHAAAGGCSTVELFFSNSLLHLFYLYLSFWAYVFFSIPVCYTNFLLFSPFRSSTFSSLIWLFSFSSQRYERILNGTCARRARTRRYIVTTRALIVLFLLPRDFKGKLPSLFFIFSREMEILNIYIFLCTR